MDYDWKQLGAKIAKVGMTFLATGGVAALGGAAPLTILIAGLTGEAISGELGEIAEGIVSGIQPKDKGVYTRFKSAIQDCVTEELKLSNCPQRQLKKLQTEIMNSLFGFPANTIVAATAEPQKAASCVREAFTNYIPDRTFSDEEIYIFVDGLFSRLAVIIDNDHEFTTSIILKTVLEKMQALQATAGETLRVATGSDEKLNILIEIIPRLTGLLVRLSEQDGLKLSVGEIQTADDGATEIFNIIIPIRLQEFLGKSNNDFLSWIPYINALFTEYPHYYSEYGGQGVSHINELLKYVDALIPKNQKLSEKATMFLIAGVILHDVGRQLTQEGFMRLLKSPSWLKRWKEYHSRACRFSDSEQINRYGEHINVIALFPKYSVISEGESNQGKLIISDFIREWHGYIAYDSAKENINFNSGISLFNFAIEDDYRDLIGCIALSHKMALRDVEPLIANSRYGGISADKPFGTPVFYLMALLRIADYFDAKAQHSPFQRKWILPQENPELSTLKQVVRSITFPPDSPQHDSAWIDAKPSNTRTFVITKEWIDSIQYELDYSWAVLCEKYSAEFAFSIHRVYSNVTDTMAVKAFQKDFVTDKAFLKADTNILKHLIAPLYGNDASYGVRELIANAVDAVNERFFAEKKRGGLFERKIDVRIEESVGSNNQRNYMFKIIDTGIGMTLDVILNYYLTSGVSFRESEEWRKLFASGKKIEVVRTGRFGVGALSAFLLGDSITVTTRHMNEDSKGYRFTFSLSSEIINIHRVDCEIGTSIEIPITNYRYARAMAVVPHYLKADGKMTMAKSSPGLVRIGNLYDELNDEEQIQYTGFGCFRYSMPKVSYNYCGTDINVLFNKIPSKRDIERGRFSDWYSFVADGYFVAWKPPSFSPRKKVRYFCNGFKFSSVNNNIERDFGCDMGHPIFSAEDTLGLFPCDLARDKITLPDEFIIELFRYKMSLLFNLDIQKTLIAKKAITDLFGNRYSLMLSKEGFTLSNHLFIRHAKVDSYFTHNCMGISNFMTTDTQLPYVQYGIEHINNKISLGMFIGFLVQVTNCTCGYFGVQQGLGDIFHSSHLDSGQVHLDQGFLHRAQFAKLICILSLDLSMILL